MEHKNTHIFINETEGAKDRFNYKVEAEDIMLDLKVLLKEYYAATFGINGKSLKISFNNGQVFKLSVLEEK